MGIDRDEDHLRDGVETDPGVFVNASDTGTSPALFDTDGDGLDDGFEVAQGSDPTDPMSTPEPSPWLLAIAALSTLSVLRRQAVH